VSLFPLRGFLGLHFGGGTVYERLFPRQWRVLTTTEAHKTHNPRSPIYKARTQTLVVAQKGGKATPGIVNAQVIIAELWTQFPGPQLYYQEAQKWDTGVKNVPRDI